MAKKTNKLKQKAAEVKSNTAEQERDRVTQFIQRFEVCRDARIQDGIEDEWREAEDLYYQRDDIQQEGEWRSNAWVPHATREVHASVPHLVSSVIDADKIVTVTPLKPEDADYAVVEERTLLHQLENKMDFANRWEVFQKQKSMLGTTVGMLNFRQKKITTTIKARIKTGAKSFRTTSTVEEAVIDATNEFTPLDIADVWVDPTATPHQIRRVFHYERKSINDLKKIKGIKNLDKLPLDPGPLDQFFASTRISADDPDRIGTKNENTDETRVTGLAREFKLHHILWEYDNETKMYSAVGAGDVEILEPRAFPWDHKELPFIFDWYEFLPGRFYGWGVIVPIARAARNANRLRRMRDDNVELSINQMFVTRQGAITDAKKELLWRPGGNINVRGNPSTSIMALQVPDVTQSAYADERIIKDDIEAVNGISSVASGKGDPNSPTATGTTILQQQAVLRLRNPIRKSMIALGKMVHLMRMNNNQFIPLLDKQKLLGVSANIYAFYTEDFLDRTAEVNIHPAKLYDRKEIRNAQVLNAINIMNSMGIAQSVLNPVELGRWLMTEVGGIEPTSPIFAQPKSPLTNAADFMDALADMRTLASGQTVLPQEDDNHAVHMEMLTMLKGQRPDLAVQIDQLIQQHGQMEAEAQARQSGLIAPGAGLLGPGAGPQQGGQALNPQRQPSPTDEEGLVRGAARQQGGVQDPTRGPAVA